MLLLAVLVLASPVVAHAAVITTAPLSGTINTGTAQCVVSNLLAKVASVTVTIVDTAGNIVPGGFGPTPLGPGATTETPEIDLDTDDVSYCRCVVPNKANFRCSLVLKIGGSVTVVPGQ
jgi:hypothetical protein